MSQSKPKILILEDNHTDQLLLDSTLSEKFDLSFASEITEAQKLLNISDFHLFIVDLYLPDGNGFSFIKELKKTAKTNNLPVMLVTSSTKSNISDAARVVGVNYFMSKPLNPKVVFDSVSNILGNGSAA